MSASTARRKPSAAPAPAQQCGLTQVELVERDIHDPAPGGPFDAIVGRFILMYVPDPVAVLGGRPRRWTLAAWSCL